MLPKPIIYLSILLVFIYSSCSEPVELDVPETAKQLVVNSIITEGEAVTVSLSTTISMLAESTPEIANAEVSLWSEDKFIANLVYSGNKHYTTDSVIEAGKNYNIIVNTKNNGGLKASCYTPKPIPLTDGYIRYGVLYNNDVDSNLDEVSITFTDAPNEENYYEIGFYELRYQRKTVDGLLLTDSTVQLVRNIGNLTSNDPIILAEGDMDFEYIADRSTLIFSDQYIKNPCTLVFYFGNATYLLGWNSETGWRADTEPVYAVLKSISKEYYMYKKSWIRHKYNQGMVNIYNVEDLTKLIFTGNPFDMYTNVDGGLGIFAGYAQSQLLLKSIFEFPDGPPTNQK